MERNLQALEDRTFDLLVVGGGIFGACAACDAARRGLSVALIERQDFSSAASANSFKLVHGGFRYLQHADVIRVRESSRARRIFLRCAPHLVHPLPIVVPTYGRGARSKWLISLAMKVYEALTPDRNRGIRDLERRIPPGSTLSRAGVLDQYPGLDPEGLTGAAVFADGQMYNPPRLVLAFLQSASRAGAVIANYVEAQRFVLKDGKIRGVLARDRLTGDELEIRARCTLNAAGPYAEGLLKSGLGLSLEPTEWSRDAYFVLPRRVIGGRAALALTSQTKDPEAVFSRGARHLFLIPWRGYTLAGVWHKVYRRHPDGFTVTDGELEAFVAEIRSGYRLDITPDDICLWNAGLIPFGENDPSARDLKFGHRSRLVDHIRTHSVDGLITLIGVRFTTAPCEAPKAVDLALAKLGVRAARSRLEDVPAHGGAFETFESLVREVMKEMALPEDCARALAHNYGSGYREIADLTRQAPELAETIGSTSVLKAQIVHAVRSEMGLKLTDVVLRRTDLGTGEYPGSLVIEECARLMAKELGWIESRVEQEIDALEALYPRNLRKRQEWRETPARSA
ncbi:MAG TPA: glycerol-3-phosphate dehydrogenase/oxidase [Acidobacteriota bacterium]|nr:glycerol-3-phosphate dehydrogenase/oxidase [Acidobacteriota bacterium]